MSYSATPRQSAVLSNGTAATQAMPALGLSVAAGSLVAGAVAYDSTVTLNSVSDNGGNATYNLKSTITDTTDLIKITSFSLGNVGGSPTTITFHFSGAANSCAVVGEWIGGLAAADPNDGTTGQFQTTVAAGANNVTTGNVTTTIDGDLIVGAAVEPNTTAPTTGTSPSAFTSVGTASDTTSAFALRFEAFVQTTHAAIAATFGISVANDPAASNVVAFKPSATGATTPANRQQDWPNPAPLPQIDRTWAFSQTRMLGQDQVPNRRARQSFDLPSVLPPPEIDRTWTWRQVDKLGKDRLPNRQQDWPNPVPPPRVDAHWAWGFDPRRIVTTSPFNQFDWPNPATPVRVEASWTWRQTGMLGQDRLPFRQQDWPNPTPTIGAQTWTWRQTDRFGQDILPFWQQDWPLPTAPPAIDRTWIQGFSQTLSTIVVQFPHNQYDWPNPVPPPSIDRSWLQGFVLPLRVLVFYPPFYWDWPNPAPLPWTDARAQGLNPNLATIPVTIPRHQFDWPNPAPISQIDRTWAWNQARMLGQDRLPFRQQDWPNPPPLPNIDHSWIQPLNRPLATFVAPPLPHHQYDWPNPLAPPNIDHFWIQLLLPLVTPPPAPPPPPPGGELRWNLERAGWPHKRRKPTLLEILADIIEEEPPPALAEKPSRRQKARATAEAQRWAEEIVERAQRQAQSYELEYAKATIATALSEHAAGLIEAARQRRLDQEEEEAILLLLSHYH